jgi:uncharacterized protein YjbI with pentapeptide repeats
LAHESRKLVRAANLKPANLKPANLKPANLKPATLKPATLKPAILERGTEDVFHAQLCLKYADFHTYAALFASVPPYI